MKISRQINYPNEIVSLAYIAKVLGHPARLAIIKALATKGVCTCGELVNELPLSQAAVSKQLIELLKSRLIIGEIKGTYSFYSINWRTFDLLEQTFSLFFFRTGQLKPDPQPSVPMDPMN